MSCIVPLIDFSKCGLLVAEDDVREEHMRASGEELYSALSTSGFAYLANHGIEWSLIDEMNEVGEKFYSLPLDVKLQFEKQGYILSYDSIGRSKANKKDIDCYEGFRTGGEAYTDETVQWPDVPGMKECYTRCADHFKKILMRVLKTLGHGMKLKDRDYFCKVHSLMNQKGNYSIIKTLKYPPISDDDAATEHRIGEHTDKTTLTLLFQDNNGGLQAKDTAGNLFDINPIPGTIVLNVGTTLEAWSKNRLKATIHKVILPSDPAKRRQIRRSVAYFAQANADTLMERFVFDDGADEGEVDEKVWTVKEYMDYTVAEVITNIL